MSSRYALVDGKRQEVTGKKQYGICPPLWNIWGKAFLSKQNKTKENGNTVSFTAKVNRHLSSNFFRSLIPSRFCWLLVFEVRNKNQNGAKELYDSIADETKNAYS